MNTQLNNIRKIKNSAIISDIALGFEPEIEVNSKWDLLDRYIKSGFNYAGLALAGEFTSLEASIKYIARHRQYILNQPDKFILVEKSEDILTAKKENKLALGFWLQGSAPIANDINMIDIYYKLGIRYMLLAYNNRNVIGDGILEKIDAGLSQFGLKVIEEMNRVGMLIDLSHAGINTALEAIEYSKDPVIFSHSNAYGLVPHVRNINDQQIKAVAEKNGIIGINSVAQFLGVEKSSVAKFVDQIDCIANLIGHAENISLGLDMIYFDEILPLFYQKAAAVAYPNDYIQSLDSLRPEALDQLIEELIKRQYNESTIKNILGGNFLRVAQQVWR